MTIINIISSDYTINSMDNVIGVGSINSDISITLPSSPGLSDQFVIKDVEGNAGIYKITLVGDGYNIDGQSSFIISQSFASYSVLFTGSQWSITLGYAGQQNGNGFGLLSNRPIQGQSGRTYYAIDQAVFYYDDGNLWNTIGPQARPVFIPKMSDFTWVNQNGATATDTGSGLYLQTLGINSGYRSARMLVKTAPTTPYSIRMCFEYAAATTFGSTNGLVGLCFRESSSGKIQNFTVDFNQNGDCILASLKYDDENTFDSNYNSKVNEFISGIMWLEISDDGNNRYCNYSRDGINFTNFHFVGNTDFITADQVGLFVDPIFQDIKVTFVSWQQE